MYICMYICMYIYVYIYSIYIFIYTHKGRSLLKNFKLKLSCGFFLYLRIICE